MWRLALIAACAVVVLPVSAQPYQPTARTLLLDHLDDSFTPDGARCTAPAKIKTVGDFAGGRPTKGGEFVAGKFGQALQFHGLMEMWYPAPGNINLSAGSAEFRVALNFDAAPTLKNPGLLSNQLFLTVWGADLSRVCVYSCLNVLCVGVWDRERQLVCYANYPCDWRKGEWHHVELRWGRQLELWCDDKRQATQDWFGLFGPIDVKPEELKLSFGSHIGWSGVHSEFALDEVRVLGPGGEQTPDYPVMTIPRIKPPVVDGQIGEEEWASAAQTTGFVALNKHELVEDQTIVRAGWDAQALYVSFECLDPQQRPIMALLKERDAGVYTEDAVDVFLQPRPLPAPYYQLITSALGTVYDSRVTPEEPPQSDTRFNPNWTVKTSKAPGRWVMEARLPFAELDGLATPQDGDRWRVNFCRDADSASRLSEWSYIAGNFHNWSAYGEIIFSDSRSEEHTSELQSLS
jgi:hypothetical protein